MSKSVSQLERELRVTLVERTTHAVRLTAAGEALLESGRAALSSVDAAFESAREVGQGFTGAFRVGCSPAVGPADRRELVDQLRADAPTASVLIEEVRPDQLVHRLEARELDFGLTRTVGDVPAVQSVPLRPSQTILCVPEGHRLAGATSVSLSDLDGERLLVWSGPGTPFTDFLLARVREAGATVQPMEAKVMGGGFSLAELNDRGAVALMPARWHPQEGVVQVELAEEVTLPLLLVWRVGPVPPVVQRIRAAMSGG